MILSTVKIKPKRGQADALLAGLREMVAVSRQEPGTVAYEPYRSVISAARPSRKSAYR